MRILLGALAVLVVLWIAFVASPYVALYELGRGVEAGDGATVAERINFRALRHSTIANLATEVGAARAGSVTASDAQLAASAIAAAADPLIAPYLTGAGVVSLLRPAGSEPSDMARSAFATRETGLARLVDILGSSSWRGFRTVYFILPPGASRDHRFRLQLRFSRLRWRLVGLELPAATRKRLAAELVRRVRP